MVWINTVRIRPRKEKKSGFVTKLLSVSYCLRTNTHNVYTRTKSKKYEYLRTTGWAWRVGRSELEEEKKVFGIKYNFHLIY